MGMGLFGTADIRGERLRNLDDGQLLYKGGRPVARGEWGKIDFS
jgi:hypothetical protein